MASGIVVEQPPVPAEAKPTAAPVDVLPLLKAYARTIAASANPPASLRSERLARWTRRIRPTWGCQFFTVRYVRRQVQAVERALGQRIAVGEHDADDEQELAALERFRTSLPPPPSRWLAVVGLVAAILMAQALLGQMLPEPGSGERGANDITRAFGQLDSSLDAQSMGDLARALAGGTVEELLIVLMSVAAIVYLYARPLAVGYGLAYMLLGRPGRRSRRNRDSPLTRLADELGLQAREGEVARQAGVKFRRDPPVDLLAKAVVPLILAFIAIVFARIDDPIVALVIGAIAGARIVWLLVRLRSRRYPLSWITAPVAVLCALALITPSELESDDWTDREELAWARHTLGYDVLPRVAGSDLRLKLATSSRLDGLDLRGMDMPRALLGGKSLRDTNFEAADLRRADLTGSDLRGAVLRAAWLRGADLRGADLRGTDLRCANLASADLREAEIGPGTLLDEAWHSRRTRWPAGFPVAERVPIETREFGWYTLCVLRTIE
jgi:hypothetical protein